jgi:2'-hydroxyisoflavone reductase
MFSKKSRREFIELSVKSGLAIPVIGSGLLSCTSSNKKSDEDESNSKLNILILGGTSFLGPHQIAYALNRGHSISTFTRGKTEPTVHQGIFDKVERLIGDRENNLKALMDRKWDAVIDNSGHKVEWTEKTAELLKDNVGLYLYTSSTGVYYPYRTGNIREDQELVLEEPEGIEDEEMKIEYRYGVMKSNSEIAARLVMTEQS